VVGIASSSASHVWGGRRIEVGRLGHGNGRKIQRHHHRELASDVRRKFRSKVGEGNAGQYDDAPDNNEVIFGAQVWY